MLRYSIMLQLARYQLDKYLLQAEVHPIIASYLVLDNLTSCRKRKVWQLSLIHIWMCIRDRTMINPIDFFVKMTKNIYASNAFPSMQVINLSSKTKAFFQLKNHLLNK